MILFSEKLTFTVDVVIVNDLGFYKRLQNANQLSRPINRSVLIFIPKSLVINIHYISKLAFLICFLLRETDVWVTNIFFSIQN